MLQLINRTIIYSLFKKNLNSLSLLWNNLYLQKRKFKLMRLSDLQTGEKGVIVKVLGHGGFRKRIVEMGFIKGKTVEVILNAPLKDPIKYRILGYEVSLRRSEAEMIEVVNEEEVIKALGDDAILDGLHEDITITEKQLENIALGKRRTIKVALVGNPNCGKTSLFNIASGAHAKVGNYGGVTVDAHEGHFDFEGYRFKLVDLPGTYSLSAYTPEEKYVRTHLVQEMPDIVINVVDASNLERNLYLTTQLIDMNLRMVVALNIFDELEARGDKLDYIKLSKKLGVPMVPTICRQNKGIDNLFHIIINLYEGADFMDKDGNIYPEVQKQLQDWHENYVDESKHEKHIEDYTESHVLNHKKVFKHIHINHGAVIEKAIDELKAEISKNESIRDKYSTRFLAIKMLENDPDIEELLKDLPNGKEILKVRDKTSKNISSHLNEDTESAITDSKYRFIDGLLKQTLKSGTKQSRKITEWLDMLVTHRIWGYPIFILFMYIMFSCTFILGEYPMMGIEWLVEQLGELISGSMDDGVFKDMLVNGVVTGVGGVIVFLPNILILYFFISLMEESGYMARAAFIMDKLMNKMGLHGKSFIPLLMGFGCNVPAIMASRTIENRKNRLVTILVNPLMSCGARLPIYLILIGAFFPSNQGLVLLSIYLIGIILAIVMAKVFTKFLVKGDNTPFVMELPPYRMPTSKAILRHTWDKGSQYLKKMGSIILIASVIVWFLGTYPKGDYATEQEQQENSYIGHIGKAIEPAIAPLGFDWKMGVGLLSGAGAKELVVSTLSVLYGSDEEGTNLAEKMNITPLVAYAYMVFSLLYFPCVAAVVAVKQEAGGWRWAIFTIVYTTVLAWVMSFLVYRIGGLFL